MKPLVLSLTLLTVLGSAVSAQSLRLNETQATSAMRDNQHVYMLYRFGSDARGATAFAAKLAGCGIAVNTASSQWFGEARTPQQIACVGQRGQS